MLEFPFKDADEVLDYVINWEARLGTGGDVIATSSWFFDPAFVEAASLGAGTLAAGPLAMDSESNTDTTATVWLSGGTEGTTYYLTNRVTTTGGRTMDQTTKIKIKQK